MTREGTLRRAPWHWVWHENTTVRGSVCEHRFWLGVGPGPRPGPNQEPATELAPSPCDALRQLLLHRASRRRVKAVFLAHFPVPENGGVPTSPLASTARSMAFLRDTMGVSDANAVCVDLWPHMSSIRAGATAGTQGQGQP